MSFRYFPTCAALLVLATAAALAQDPAVGTKTLLVDRPLNNDPVRITKVMEGTAELKSDGHPYPNKYVWEATFSAGDDWLRDLSFVIKNVSQKKIIYVETACGLYETADWQAELAKHRNTAAPLVGQISNTVGRRPEQALYSALLGRRLRPDAEKAPFELAPGQEFAMATENSDDYMALKSRIAERQPISNITACNGSIGRIFFEDGTLWQGHHYSRADLDHPGRWIRMSFEEWPGSQGR